MRIRITLGVSVALGMLVALSGSIHAQQVVVLGSGSGALEAAGVGGPVNNGTIGYAQCTFDRSAQSISCTSRVYNLVDLTAGHIHVGGPGTSGPVIISIPSLPVRLSGTYGQSWTWLPADMTPNPAVGINTFDDLLQACAAGNCYLNWHTTASPGGAMRINLCPASRAANSFNGIAVCTSGQ